MPYQSVLFQAIAKEVVNGHAEQYLVSFANGSLTVMFSTPAVENAIEKACAQRNQLGNTSIISAEYMMGVGFVAQDCVFSDECEGVMDVGGVLVNVDIRKIKDGVHRVLFSRVDAARLHHDLIGRVKALEKSVEDIKTGM